MIESFEFNLYPVSVQIVTYRRIRINKIGDTSYGLRDINTVLKSTTNKSKYSNNSNLVKQNTNSTYCNVKIYNNRTKYVSPVDQNIVWFRSRII